MTLDLYLKQTHQRMP